MVILGGLEIVAGGYLFHRYQRNKSEKKRLEQEAQQRRYNTFPGAKPQPCHPSHPQHAVPPQKYGYVAHAPPSRPQPPYPPLHRPSTEPPPHRPHNARHASQPQSFMIPRRPLPKQQHAPPPQMIQPLQRADSMATISRMPIANGYRPSHVADDPQLPPRRQNPQLSPIPQSPYGNPGFAVSSPAFINNPTTQTYSPTQHGGRQTMDDNWETYNNHAHYAPSLSTALGETRDDDPPPPYRP
ncbi:hypothetical protein P171DRAFT_166285 [Karstenula rhodostoma CBS 690.94]|uniref:PAT1 multi-domain protein n=1 Tax=Karstenula rhodostoma CBS 690.94 TaxID=1392251 RepID=A0A9P4P7M7_9PLEO|nr:hypothetical protein P171DRAFT_166285 [Karstenula rhodostoma CBS 690.94]